MFILKTCNLEVHICWARSLHFPLTLAPGSCHFPFCFWVWLFQIFHVSIIMKYLSLCDGLISCSWLYLWVYSPWNYQSNCFIFVFWNAKLIILLACHSMDFWLRTVKIFLVYHLTLLFTKSNKNVINNNKEN